MDRFTLRGQIKVNIQWMLYYLVHNIEKIANFGKSYAMAAGWEEIRGDICLHKPYGLGWVHLSLPLQGSQYRFPAEITVFLKAHFAGTRIILKKGFFDRLVRPLKDWIMDTWKFYDITHREHVVCNPTSEEKLARLVDLLGLPTDAQVVDVACGKGEFLIRLSGKQRGRVFILDRLARDGGSQIIKYEEWRPDPPFTALYAQVNEKSIHSKM
jgi:hypothetical protein